MQIILRLFLLSMLFTFSLNITPLSAIEFDTNAHIFKYFPCLQETLPHITLGDFPTPILKADKFSVFLRDAFGIDVKNIYIKQDNLSGRKNIDGTHIFGGNKVRKLEFILADALLCQAETILTVGDAGSNHALTTAVYSKLIGLDCIIMLAPQLNTSYLQRNLLMDLYYSPTIKAYFSEAQRTVDEVKISRDFILAGKQSPYYIPMGGSNEVGTVGFVNAAFELKEQINQNIIPEPDYIYVTLGSAGTAAGLILGCKAAGLKTKIVAVRISGTPEIKTSVLQKLIISTNKYLHMLDANFPTFEIKENDYIINQDFAGKKYAEATKEGALAIRLLRAFEKIQLDGTYTGKTFAALLFDLIKKPELKDKKILFWNTYCCGKFSEITSEMDYKKLPDLLQGYFKVQVQRLDQGC
jgi:1-aminocyclopropane-1-carboxylate deaminase/D-cysteine desulfhydrase-like pyridoxal-dependent ACC family enzyme